MCGTVGEPVKCIIRGAAPVSIANVKENYTLALLVPMFVLKFVRALKRLKSTVRPTKDLLLHLVVIAAV